jgi:putative transposase
MKKISYDGYRFPPGIIQQAIWLYLRFTLSFRDVEDLLAERGIMVSYETVRRWVNHFGPMIAADLRHHRLLQLPRSANKLGCAGSLSSRDHRTLAPDT